MNDPLGPPAGEGVLALILARAGSKGVPGKNVAPLAGKPCIAWSIAAAKASASVSRIAVSSDDPRALGVARSLEVDALDRPSHLATDTATVDDAARDAVWRLGHVGPVAILYANVPVRPRGLIDRAAVMLREAGCDSVQSYTTVGKHDPWWMVRVGDNGEISPWEGHTLFNGVFRRQDLPPACVPDGGVTVVTRRALFKELPGVTPGPHAFLGADRRAVMTPEGSVVDIDSPIDLAVAEAVLNGLSQDERA